MPATRLANSKRISSSTRQPSSPERRQRPQALEHAEWAADELHQHAPVGLEQVARGEFGPQRSTLDIERGHDLAFLARLDARGRAPGHELRVTLDVVDERIHARRRLRDQRRTFHFTHGANLN